MFFNVQERMVRDGEMVRGQHCAVTVLFAGFCTVHPQMSAVPEPK